MDIGNGKIFCEQCQKWIEADEMACKSEDLDKIYCDWYCNCGAILIYGEEQ